MRLWGDVQRFWELETGVIEHGCRDKWGGNVCVWGWVMEQDCED